MNGYLGDSALRSIIYEHRLIPHLIMAFLLFWQCIDIYLKKRFQINFIRENSFLGIILRFYGLYVIILEGIAVFISDDKGFDPTGLLILSGVLLFLSSYILHLFKSRDYNVYYTQESELDLIVKEVFNKHRIKIHRKEELDYIIDLGEEKNPTLTINQKGFIKKYYELKFKRHKYIYNFDEVILDLKDKVITSTKPSRYRGIEELVTAISLVIMVLVIYRITIFKG